MREPLPHLAKCRLVGISFLKIKQYYDPVIVDIIRLVAFYSVVYLAILLANIHFIRQTKKKVFF